MMKRFIAVCVLAFGLVAGMLAPPAMALNPFETACGGANSDTTICKGSNDTLLGSDGIVRKVINLLMTLAGVIAVIVIIIGGIRYTTSGGDAGNTKSAKNTILYAIIGLVVAIMSFAIVNFVLDRI